MAKIGAKKLDTIPTSIIIKVNPYENPERALQMATRISTAVSHSDASIILKTFSDNLLSDKFPDTHISRYLDSIKSELSDKDIWMKIRNCLLNLKILLEARENTEHTQIVVAGGFASGKSSFLNAILEVPDLLPTDIGPSSVVPTYLYCSKNSERLVVKGVNYRNAVVGLDREVLQCIQHGSKTNVYISSLLNKLLVEIRSEEHDGLAYIDTPGYNNYEKAIDGDGNERTDRKTAIDSLKEGNVLYWIHDINTGAITEEDKKIIESFKGKIVIIFNKADMQSETQIKNIINFAQKDFNAKSKNSKIIDIIAFSSFNNMIYYSMRGYDKAKLLKKVRATGSGKHEIQRIQEQIDLLIEEEINAQISKISKLELQKQELNDYKNNADRKYREKKDSNSELIESMTRNNIGKDYIMRIRKELNELEVKYKNEFYDFSNQWNRLDEKKKRIETISNELHRFRGLIKSTLRRGLNSYYKKEGESYVEPSQNNIVIDIFEAIRTRDMNAFLDCFATGLDIVKTLSPEGYSPLTYVVSCGENDMLEFLLAHGANLNVNDGRGYNAFLTAVENNYRDLCQMMLSKNKALLYSKSSKGETAMDIAQKRGFEKWLNEQ